MRMTYKFEVPAVLHEGVIYFPAHEKEHHSHNKVVLLHKIFKVNGKSYEDLAVIPEALFKELVEYYNKASKRTGKFAQIDLSNFWAYNGSSIRRKK